MRMHVLACQLLAAVAPLACDDTKDVSCDELERDAPPLTGGNWYRPSVDTTWQWQLIGSINTSYDVGIYDIDLFDTDPAVIATLKGQGRKVICYFSAGSSEDWRSDFGGLEEEDMGEPLDGWDGERWLNVCSTNVHRIMLARLDLAVTKGCDGVEPDNVDGFANRTGFALKSNDQLAYNRHIANQAHQRGLTVGLKNDGEQAKSLVDYYDFALNEQCHEYAECSELGVFVAHGKPVLNAEYAESPAGAQQRGAALCAQARLENIRTLVLPLNLDDSFRVSCD